MARDRLLVGLALVALAAVAALAVGNMRIEPSARHLVALPVAPTAEQPAVAEAYRYPLGCLGESLSRTHDELDRTSPCWRYGVYVTVVLRRVGRTWRMALEAVSPSCPRVMLPSMIEAQLAACTRAAVGAR